MNRSCLRCSFVDHCQHSASMAMKIILRGVSFADGLSFFEVKAKTCNAFATDFKLKPLKREKQLSFKF